MGTGDSKQLQLIQAMEEGIRVDESGAACRLDLQGLQLSERDTRKLAERLRRRKLRHLKTIRLGDCSLTSMALEHVTKSLCASAPHPQLVRVELSTQSVPPIGNPIGNGGAFKIAQLLQYATSIKHLHLAHCHIGSDGAASIAQALANSSSLQTLNLSNNQIANQGAIVLGKALRRNKTLRGLSLWDNDIRAGGAAGLAKGLEGNTSLHWLGLGNNSIDNEGVKAIALALQRNVMRSKLKWLALGNNHISDEGADHLSSLLSAGWSSIDDDDDNGPDSAACPLQSLGLGGNQITDTGVLSLARGLESNNRLLSLGLSHNYITNEGAGSLADLLLSNDTLQSLIISNNNIGSEGANSIVAALTDNRTLTALYLADNPLEDDVCDSFAHVLTKQNKALRTLDLHNTQISAEAFQQLINKLQTNDSVVSVLGGGFSGQDDLPPSGNILEQAKSKTLQSSVLPRKTLFDGVNIAERADLLSSFPQQQQQLRRQNTSQLDRHQQQERQQRSVGHSGEWRRSTVASSWSEEQEDERTEYHLQNALASDDIIAEEVDYHEQADDPSSTSQHTPFFTASSHRHEQPSPSSSAHHHSHTPPFMSSSHQYRQPSLSSSHQPSPSVSSRHGEHTIPSPASSHQYRQPSLSSSHQPSPSISSRHGEYTIPSPASSHQYRQPSLSTSHQPSPSASSRHGDRTPLSSHQPSLSQLSLSSSHHDWQAAPSPSFLHQYRQPSQSSLQQASPSSSRHDGHTHHRHSSLPSSHQPSPPTSRPQSQSSSRQHSRPPSSASLQSRRAASALSDGGSVTTSRHADNQLAASAVSLELQEVSLDMLPVPDDEDDDEDTLVGDEEIVYETGFADSESDRQSAISTGSEVVSRDPLLSSPTRDRPDPPSGRKPPSKQSHHQPCSTKEQDTTSNEEAEEPLEMLPREPILPPTTKGRPKPPSERRPPSRQFLQLQPGSTKEQDTTSNEEAEEPLEMLPREPTTTRGRPKPPSVRRPPSKQFLHLQPGSTEEQDTSFNEEPLEEEAGDEEAAKQDDEIEAVWADEEVQPDERPLLLSTANSMMASSTPIANSADSEMSRMHQEQQQKPLTQQWMQALQMRVGMLKMGGFLHAGFEAVEAANSSHQYNYSMARLPVNMNKNREDAPLPSSNSRVKLQVVMEEIGSDYINACFIGSPSYPKSYVITQLPTDDTLGDFWRMIWENRMAVIVVLTDGGEEESRFWPDEGEGELHSLVMNGEWQDGALCVSTQSEESCSSVPGLLEVSLTLHSTADQQGDNVHLLYYPHWPENGVPQSAVAAASLFHHSLAVRLNTAAPAPMVVISRQGGGRAGCFCAVAIAYEFMKAQDTPQSFDNDSNLLNSVVRGIRTQREGLVSNLRQFQFCHHMLGEALWGTATEQTDGGGPSDKTSKSKGRWKFWKKKAGKKNKQ